MPPVAIATACPRVTIVFGMMPVWITSSARCTRRGTSSDAPNVSSAITAKPSTFERSNEGTSTGDTTSAARTRPSAVSRATVSIPRGERSIAARKRRSASSRSSTLRNCSCSVTPEPLAKGGSRIEPDVDLGASAEAFAVVADDHEPVCSRRRREHGGAGDCEWFDAAVLDPHARVVEASNRRTDLAGERAADAAIRPLLRAAPERTNRTAGEEVVCAQGGHRIARQQEHEPLADCAHPGGAARTHRDAVHGEVAVRRDQHRREILDPDARSTRDDHDVGRHVRKDVPYERIENPAGVVAHEAREVDDGTVAFGERSKHRTVGVGDVNAAWLRARREQLVAGDYQTNARLPQDTDTIESNRTDHTEVLRPK